MANFNTLEELRTKKELVNYFAQRGQSITEDEIEKLKKSYEQAEENSGALSLKQLDDVAGGIITDPSWRLFYRKNNHSILPHSCPDLSAHAAAETALAQQ